MWRTSRLFAPAVLVAGVLAGCADTEPQPLSGTTGFPMTVENCGRDVTFDEPPERVVLLGDGATSLLAAAGAMDRVVARAGEFPLDLYDKDTRSALQRIPSLGGGQDASGTVQVSLEAVIAQQPDLVIGYEPEGSGVTAEALEAAGIPMLVLPAFCSDPSYVPPRPGFDDVYEAVEFYGRVFGTGNTATATAVELRQRVSAVVRAARDTPARSSAALFVYTDGTAPSAYGTSSMAHAQLKTAGLRNVFGDVDKRNFEVGLEEILARNPRTIVLLSVTGDPQEIKGTFLAMPGTKDLTAVRNNDVLVLPFQVTDPPSPLSVDGLETIAREFGTRR